MQLGEVVGAVNVGGILGLGNRQVAYNYYYPYAYIQITNCYAVGKITASGEVGGLIGQLTSLNAGSTTVTNSYWTPETTMQESSKGGIRKSIQAMLYSSGYLSWDMTNIWTIEEENTLAYLKNVSKPNQVNKENLSYEAFDIVGSGTEADPYIITNAVQLQKVNENLEAYYKLGSDVDLTGRNWTPIGNMNYPFKGQIDGNGYFIKNLTINKDSSNMALFGYNQGTLKNVKLDNFNITGNDYVGGLLSYNIGNVQGCEISQNSTISGHDYVGGLIGYTIGVVTGSTSNAVVTGNSNVGGIIGYVYTINSNLTVESLVSTGKVTGVTNVGGLVGISNIEHTGGVENVTYSVYIKKSYASGEVIGSTNVGGLVGLQQSNMNAYNHYKNIYNYIQESYATRKSNR